MRFFVFGAKLHNCSLLHRPSELLIGMPSAFDTNIYTEDKTRAQKFIRLL